VDHRAPHCCRKFPNGASECLWFFIGCHSRQQCVLISNVLVFFPGTPSSGIGRDSDMWAVVPFVEHDESNSVETLKRRDSHNMELMDDFVEMERLAVLQSETAMPEAGVETASVASLQQQLSDLEKALADKDQDLQARSASLVHLQHQVDDLEKALEDKAQDLQTANESCRDLNLRLADSAEQIAALQACNDANETSMRNLQVQLDGLIAEQEGGGGAWSLSNHKDVPEGLPLISEAELKACVSTISTHSYTCSCISQVP
jgi:flagellar biosynthesis chaperone FliJ